MNNAMTAPQSMAMVAVDNVNNRDVEIKELTMDRNVMMEIMYQGMDVQINVGMNTVVILSKI